MLAQMTVEAPVPVLAQVLVSALIEAPALALMPVPAHVLIEAPAEAPVSVSASIETPAEAPIEVLVPAEALVMPICVPAPHPKKNVLLTTLKNCFLP